MKGKQKWMSLAHFIEHLSFKSNFSTWIDSYLSTPGKQNWTGNYDTQNHETQKGHFQRSKFSSFSSLRGEKTKILSFGKIINTLGLTKKTQIWYWNRVKEKQIEYEYLIRRKAVPNELNSVNQSRWRRPRRVSERSVMICAAFFFFSVSFSVGWPAWAWIGKQHGGPLSNK